MYWEPVNLFIPANVPVHLLLGMSASEDMQLCPTLRSAPSYRKLPPPVLHALPRGRLWPMTGEGWESQPRHSQFGRALESIPAAECSGESVAITLQVSFLCPPVFFTFVYFLGALPKANSPSPLTSSSQSHF